MKVIHHFQNFADVIHVDRNKDSNTYIHTQWHEHEQSTLFPPNIGLWKIKYKNIITQK